MADVEVPLAEVEKVRAQVRELEAAEAAGRLDTSQLEALRGTRQTLASIDARIAAQPGPAAGQVQAPAPGSPEADAALLVGAMPDRMGRLAPELAAARERTQARQILAHRAAHPTGLIHGS